MKRATFFLASVAMASFACGSDLGPVPEGADAADSEEECLPAETAEESGEHNPGADCMSAGCHGSDSAIPAWTVAGTLYDDTAGTNAVAGSRIVLVDGSDKTVVLTTAQNGNFYTEEELEFPLKVEATACPTTLEMNSEVAESGGSCNTSGCHASAFRIYLSE